MHSMLRRISRLKYCNVSSMFIYKNRYSILFKAIAMALIFFFIANDIIAFALPATFSESSARSALAPPLFTKPPAEIYYDKNAGKWDVVTNDDAVNSRNKWAFVDLSYLIGQMLQLTVKHKLQNPKDILISLIKKHIQNRKGEEEILLEGYDVDGIEEARQGDEIMGFSLPVNRQGAPAYSLIYNLKGGDTYIPMRGGAKVYMTVEDIAYTWKVEAIERVLPHRLTITECRQRLMENLNVVKALYPSLQKEFARGSEILKSEGVDAFEKKAYPKIKEVADKIKVNVDAIRALPAVFGFSGPEMRTKLDTFLRQIAEEVKVDKDLIWFGTGWLYDFTYTHGFSEKELMTFHLNSNDLFWVLSDRFKTKDEKIWKTGKALLKECGIISAFMESPAVDKWLNDEDNFITVVIGRSEEGVKKYGELTEEDRKTLGDILNMLVDNKTGPWLGVKDYLKANQYYDFDKFMMILRHNGGIDIFKVGIFPFIYDHIQYYIDKIKPNDSESPKWLNGLLKNLEYYVKEAKTVNDMDTFLEILDKGTDFKPRNITPYVHSRVLRFRDAARAKNLSFIEELTDKDLIVSDCDLNLIGILIDNLLQNAIKYTEEGGIKVRLTRKKLKDKGGTLRKLDYAVLEVEDTGIGIPEDEKSKIFKRGYRASNVVNIYGTGIGLDIVWTIAGLMRGCVEVRSLSTSLGTDEPGKGTTFTVMLPIAEKPDTGRTSASGVAVSGSERIHAVNLQDMLKYMQAEPGSGNLIVALGTSWIKGYERNDDGRSFKYEQGKDLNELIVKIRGYCSSKGIPFIDDDDDKLLKRINDEKVAKGMPSAKVVVLAGKETVGSTEFEALRNDEKNAFVVGVDNLELAPDSYVRLMEMLTITLKLSVGLEVPQNATPIAIEWDDKLKFYILIPSAEKMDYEQSSPAYMKQIEQFA